MDSPVIRKAKLRALNDKGHFATGTEVNLSVKTKAPKKARKAPYKTAALMKEALQNPEDFDPTTRRAAQMMKNLLK